jgi:hypothetical protein
MSQSIWIYVCFTQCFLPSIGTDFVTKCIGAAVPVRLATAVAGTGAVPNRLPSEARLSGAVDSDAVAVGVPAVCLGLEICGWC